MFDLFGKREVQPVGPLRPSEFRKSVEERTQPEADPVEYPTDPDQLEPAGYYAVHGDPERAEAVPVYLVEAPPEESNWTEFASATLGVGPTGTQIGDSSRNRLRFVVRNLDAVNPVFLTKSRTDSNMAAYTLPAGQTVTFEHNAAIYASAANDGTQITYFTEYDIPDPA